MAFNFQIKKDPNPNRNMVDIKYNKDNNQLINRQL